MRELTANELTAVLGGGGPLGGIDELPGTENDQRDQLLGDFYSFGYAETDLGFFESVGSVLQAFGDWLSGEGGRKEFAAYCDSQGKSPVFTAASSGFELEIDKSSGKIKLKTNSSTGSRFCR